MAEITYRQALHDVLREELLRDETVFLLGEEIATFWMRPSSGWPAWKCRCPMLKGWRRRR